MRATVKAREAQVLEIERSRRQVPCEDIPCKTPKNLMPLDAGQEGKTAPPPRVTLYRAAVAFLASQPLAGSNS